MADGKKGGLSSGENEGIRQIRALSHPLRLRLVEIFAERPRTTKQAALEMGEAPTRLYHHVSALEKAGLIRLKETRAVRGATEKYFEVAARSVGMAEKQSSEAITKMTARDRLAIATTVFDQARNELVKLLASGDLSGSTIALRRVLKLRPREAARLSKDLIALLRRYAGASREALGRPRRGDRRYSLTLALIPVERDGKG